MSCARPIALALQDAVELLASFAPARPGTISCAGFEFYANDIKLTLVIVPSEFVYTSSRSSERSSSSADSPASPERPNFSPAQTVHSPSFRCLRLLSCRGKFWENVVSQLRFGRGKSKCWVIWRMGRASI
ncbi:hypothetical protein C8F01DRAFT_1095396 [Mycena amicta]|nr:hypothetical protein C8F01DRAFT_1095396 [Mycena amicta]